VNTIKLLEANKILLYRFFTRGCVAVFQRSKISESGYIPAGSSQSIKGIAVREMSLLSCASPERAKIGACDPNMNGASFSSHSMEDSFLIPTVPPAFQPSPFISPKSGTVFEVLKT
jgi:hypothetical protein